MDIVEQGFCSANASCALIINAALDNEQETEQHTEWARTFWKATRPFSTGGAYINFMSADDGQDRVVLSTALTSTSDSKTSKCLGHKQPFQPQTRTSNQPPEQTAQPHITALLSGLERLLTRFLTVARVVVRGER